MWLTALLLSILAASLRGGRPSRLVEIKFRGALWVVVALGLQRLVRDAGLRGWPIADPLASFLFVLGYALMVYIFLLNGRLAGTGLMAFGTLMNLAAIVANGGRMPVSLAALARLGADPASLDPNLGYQAMTEATRMAWLGDWIPLRLGPFGGVASPGDFVVAVGLFWLVQVTMVRQDGAPASQAAPVA